MAVIYAAATDGGVRSYGPDDEVWNDVHDNDGSSHSFAVPTANNTVIYGPTVTFDGTNFNIYRTFLLLMYLESPRLRPQQHSNLNLILIVMVI